jgi:transcriptional regulator with XRE-family HTH domain
MGLSEKAKKRYFKKLGLRLRELRNQQGLTLEDTEEHGVKSWKHLQRIEAGEANITVETLLLLSKIYKVQPSDVLLDL